MAYIYKCDKCKYTWKDTNPTDCSKCQSEDFHILKEAGSNWKNFLIFSVILVFVLSAGIGLYFILKEPVSGDHYYELSYKKNQNSIEIICSKKVLDLLNRNSIVFIQTDDNNEVYRKENILYPCKNGEIDLDSFSKNIFDSLKIVEQSKIGEFNLHNNKTHSESKCEEKKQNLEIEVSTYYLRNDKKNCSCYLIAKAVVKQGGNKVEKSLEYSFDNKKTWSSNNRYTWSNGDAVHKVWARIKNSSIMQSKEIDQQPFCKPSVQPLTDSEVQQLFNAISKKVWPNNEGDIATFQDRCLNDNPIILWKETEMKSNDFANELFMGIIEIRSERVTKVFKSDGNCPRITKIIIK